ncbi:hypothetical protein F4811DRAFT_514410, partial [Daldinia bambusicola]
MLNWSSMATRHFLILELLLSSFFFFFFSSSILRRLSSYPPLLEYRNSHLHQVPTPRQRRSPTSCPALFGIIKYYTR